MARDGAYQEAEKKIEEAWRSGGKKLSLSHLQLAVLPESLSQLTHLQELAVSDNQLTALPESLGQLTQLRSLGLSENQLTALPESLGQLTHLRSLHLTGNRLTALPESLSQLTHLRSLHVSFSNLTAPPESLGQLTQLRLLYVSFSNLTALPDSLGQLTQLRSLGLSGNRLTALPESLSQLTQLRTLALSGNRLAALPEWLGQLTQLQLLFLGGNRLTALPEWLGQLTQLQLLFLGGNRLTALPESLGKLILLQRLDVSSNQLGALPESLGQLIQLQWLNLSSNQLTALPESLGQLTKLRGLFLHGNRALRLSPSILGPTFEEKGKEPANPSAILAFYFAQRRRRAMPLNEVKLLLVGHGRVGKTSLSKALRDVPHDEKEPETLGIERYPLPLKACGSRITAHVWDFGGQEFLHQTHQFFFSERSIYVAVLSGRQGRPMQEAEYWLRLIRTYGAGSPVVIALNQIREHPFSIDEHFLQENYPEVKAVVRTDCDPRKGIEQLRKVLAKLGGGMPSVRVKIDPAWARVRKDLEEMKESFVTFDRYREICARLGVATPEKQEHLATILDCLGIALNYRNDPRLRDTSVLKPRWLVDGIYTILRWLHKRETNGEMRIEDFSKALKDKRTYPPAMHKFLLALMEKFELCFPMEGEEGSYLVPGLLDANQPHELRKFMSRDARRIQFRYDDLRPPGLLPRFIVRSHTLSEQQPRWLRGVVLARGKARALVRGDHEGRVTDVFALGEKAEDRVWLTEFILSEMRVLNDNLPVRSFVESENQSGAWTELELLQEAALKNQETRAELKADGSTVLVNIKDTLREVESPEATSPEENPLPLFVCYAHANERTVRQLIPSLKVLARRGYISPWRDTDLVPGEDWDETIKEQLSNAQVILFMVSRDFLASKYITEEERPLAMRLMKQKKAVVVPVLLSPCSWWEENFAKLEKLPYQNDPVSSFNPRENAWALVEEGLKNVVKKAQMLSENPGFRLERITEQRSVGA
jgi:internalin A